MTRDELDLLVSRLDATAVKISSITIDGRYTTEDGFAYYNIAQFKGELPEAFKGLKDD